MDEHFREPEFFGVKFPPCTLNPIFGGNEDVVDHTNAHTHTHKDIAFRTVYAMLVDVTVDVVYVDVYDGVDGVVDDNVDDDVDDVDGFQAESLACGGWQKPQ